MKPEKSIWILEDDPGAAFVYHEILSGNYHLRIFDTIRSFMAIIPETTSGRATKPNLIIADLKLADENFLDVLSRSGAAGLGAPLIVVSSIDDAEVLRTCFNSGALDYLTKPFTRNELLVKVERFINHTYPTLATPEQDIGAPSGGVVLDACSLTVRRGSEAGVQLTAKELRIFSLIHRARGLSVSRHELQNEVWGNQIVTPKTLDVHLFHLRRKLSTIGIEIRYLSQEGYSLALQGE